MNIKLYSFIVSLLFISYSLFSQTWPILPEDDPDHYYIISCTFGEIHGTHFHEAIDIDCYEFVDADGVEVRPIENGTVIWPGSYSMLIGHNPIGNHYTRFSRYLHITPIDNLQIGDEVFQGNTVLGHVDGADIGGYTNNHLHVELGEYVGDNTFINDDDILLHPLSNNSSWQLALPAGHEDTYLPQINNIIIEPINNQANNVPSGFEVNDPNNYDYVPAWDGVQGLTFRTIEDQLGWFTGTEDDQQELYHSITIKYRTRHIMYNLEYPKDLLGK